MDPVGQDIILLYDEYTHKPLPRRVFLRRLRKLAGGAGAAAALLPLLEGTGAEAAMVGARDPRLETGYIAYPGATGEIRAYRSRLKKNGGPRPAVVVIHENRGLNPHIEDLARRLALAGYLALAPDSLSPMGGTPKDQDAARDMIRKLDKKVALANYLAAVTFLKNHGSVTGKVGCVGFCWGGAMANQLAVNSSDLSAAVVYYGRSPDLAAVAKIGAPLLLHYAGLDKRIGAGVPGYEAALKKAGKAYALHTYPGVNHAFNNDTRAARYDKSAADLAWRRTLDFFARTLGG